MGVGVGVRVPEQVGLPVGVPVKVRGVPVAGTAVAEGVGVRV